MLPYEQGGLDSLCGLYSIVNAERVINGSTYEESVALFNDIVAYLDNPGMWMAHCHIAEHAESG